MVQAPPQAHPFNLQVPLNITIQVTAAEFVAIAALNRELRLERTATGQ